MVGGGLMAIFFVITLVAWAMWSLIYFTFASHYVLTTLTDSSSGVDEVQWPRESIFDWWWKPIFFGWVFCAWAAGLTFLLAPLAIFAPTAFLIVWAAILWFVYPFSLASVLYTQNWLRLLHWGVISRMLKHYGAFVYVHAITFALVGSCVYLINRGFTDAVSMIPAAVLVPTAMLLYARHWGRFAWLSLNFLPRHWNKAAPAPIPTARHAPPQAIPTVDVEEDNADAIRSGLPPVVAGGVKAGPAPDAHGIKVAPAATTASPAAPAEEIDEWTDMRPYTFVEDPSLPSLAETAIQPAPQPVAMPAAASAAPSEEEDEWSMDKKPYEFTEKGDAWPAAVPETAKDETRPEEDRPVALVDHYAKRAKKEAKEKRKAEEAKGKLPPPSKKTPTFYAAFIAGVGNFVISPSTIMVWITLVLFSFLEFFLMFMMSVSWPFKGGQ